MIKDFLFLDIPLFYTKITTSGIIKVIEKEEIVESISTNGMPALEPKNSPKSKKWVLVLFIILTVIFFLGAAVLGYFYRQKNESYKKLSRDKQQQVDQSSKDKANLEKQLADVKKQKEDLENANKESDAEKANKQTIVKAYTETLTYVASLIDKYQGFDNWTEADYQAGLEIVKKTQNSSFLATCQWAWTRKDISQMTRFVRFLNETATGINDNL